MSNVEIKSEAEAKAVIKGLKKGSIHHVWYERLARLPKKLEGNELIIRSSFLARFGCGYENLSSTEAKRALGAEKGGLSGMVSEGDDIFYKSERTGKRCARAYPMPKAGWGKREFILNGEIVPKELLLEMGYAPSVLGIKTPKEGDIKEEQAPCMYLVLSQIKAIV